MLRSHCVDRADHDSDGGFHDARQSALGCGVGESDHRGRPGLQTSAMARLVLSRLMLVVLE